MTREIRIHGPSVHAMRLAYQIATHTRVVALHRRPTGRRPHGTLHLLAHIEDR